MKTIRKILFNGSKITVIEDNDQSYVLIKPIVEAIGLTWDTQQRMINNDPVLGSVKVQMKTKNKCDTEDKMLALPLEYLNGWLFKIPSRSYYGKKRERINEYQRNCYRTLLKYLDKNEPCSENMKGIISKIVTEAAGKDEVIESLKDQIFRLLDMIGIATSESFIKAHHNCSCKSGKPMPKNEFFQVLASLMPENNPERK